MVHQSYSQTEQMVYLAPLKLAVIDAEGTLRLQWWPKNDAMKGTALDSSALTLSPAGGPAGGARNITALLDNRNGTILEGTGARCTVGSLLFYGVEGTEDVNVK